MSHTINIINGKTKKNKYLDQINDHAYKKKHGL